MRVLAIIVAVFACATAATAGVTQSSVV